jgi:hypothetical protein
VLKRDHPLLVNLLKQTVALLGTNKGLLNRAPASHQVNDQNNRCYNQQEMYHPATNVSQESE